jgi:hypothetical protein
LDGYGVVVTIKIRMSGDGKRNPMVGMLDYRLHYAILAAEQRLVSIERQRSPSDSRIHRRTGRRETRSRRG